MTGSPSLFDAPADRAWTVGQVARAARQAVDGIGPLWIRGEVSGLKAYRSGHWYFTLRDAEAQVRCVMWRTWALQAGKPPADGTEVFVFATPTVWEERGEFRLTVNRLLVTDATGGQHREYERVKALLEKDGLFDHARKRPLPPLPMCIAVVTSLDGAALRDIIFVARSRWPAVRLCVVGSRVQGEEAERDLVRAFRLVNRLPEVECCIVARGGGAKEDLGAFNREAVCRALATVRVPTVSAVGHETDISLTDFVADMRVPTPSAAAEAVVAHRDDLSRRLAALGSGLAAGLERRTRLTAERLERTRDRMTARLTRLAEQQRARLDQLGGRLDALSPLRVLERGFSVARDADGRVLRRLDDFPAGRRFRLRITDGEVPAIVEDA